MQYKLLAIDLDDTLLRNDLTISSKNIEAIRRAVDKGVYVTIASGRVTNSVKHYLDFLGLQMPMITYQGAHVVNAKTGQVMYKKEIESEHALPIINFAEQEGIHCNIYVNDVIYIEQMNQWAKDYLHLTNNIPMEAVGKLSEFTYASTTKIILIDEHEKLKLIKPQIESIIDENISVFFSKPNYLEFTNKLGTKGEGMKFLAEHLNLKREEVIVIGDTYNDISMIQYAGMGVCMANGPDDVKQKADFVTLSNEEDGVAYAIEKFVL